MLTTSALIWTSGGHGGAGSGFVPPPTEVVYVDGARQDSYTANGSILKPFKTIATAVSQIITNGNNSTIPYVVRIAPGSYAESINLSNSALYNLVFLGYGVTVQGLSAINNDNLGTATFFGISFVANSGHVIDLSSTTNGTNFGGVTTGISFYDCLVSSNGDCLINNCALVVFDRCYYTAQLNATNVIDVDFRNSMLNQGSTFTILTASGTAPAPASFSASQIQIQNTQSLATVAVGSASDSATSCAILPGTFQRNSMTIYGTLTLYPGTRTSGSIMVESTGTLRSRGGAWDGSLTVVSGGTLAYAETVGALNLILNGSTISAGTGSPNGSVVGSPSDLYLNQSGGSINTLWVKESGVATNTGWVAK